MKFSVALLFVGLCLLSYMVAEVTSIPETTAGEVHPLADFSSLNTIHSKLGHEREKREFGNSGRIQRDTNKDMTINSCQNMMEKMETAHQKLSNDLLLIKDIVMDISRLSRNSVYLGSIRTTKTYALSTYKATFAEAYKKCLEKNMSLMSIGNEQEYNALKALYNSSNTHDSFWSSGTRDDAKSEFYWKSNGRLLSYTKWSSWPPSSRSYYNCIKMEKPFLEDSLVMKNDDCDSSYRYICEYIE